jgi:hypothetical protein
MFEFFKNKFCLLLFLIAICSSYSFAQLNKVEHNPPIINFEADVLCFKSPTHFVNKTISLTPPTYTWTIFQQGVIPPILISNATDITINFPAKTTYTIQLEALNAHYSILSRVLSIDSVLRADFIYTGCQSYFTNLSNCADTYFWDFGDSTTSTEKSPAHSYKYENNYTVKMIATSGNKTDSISRTYHAYPNYLLGTFSYHLDKDTLYCKAADSTSAGAYEFHWVWGDATTSYYFGYPGVSAKHSYAKLGRDTTYYAALLVKSLCYNGYGTNYIYIHDSTIVDGTFIYPNPMSETGLLRVLTERNKEINSVTIYNYLGQPLSQFQIDIKANGVDIGLSDLPGGVYYLKFKLGNDPKNFKIIKRQ